MTATECYACRHNDQPLGALPSRERVFDNGLWHVAHAFSSALPGWMVVVPRRHVVSLSELTATEAANLGPLLAGLSEALEDGLGARKAYAAFFAEAEGFAHLHVHVIPRSDDLPAEHRGPRVFHYLEQPQDQWVSPTTMNQIADRLRPILADHITSSGA
jgi:diadenosine tetraphosphate (Ap4A) HIT family hydrolase